MGPLPSPLSPKLYVALSLLCANAHGFSLHAAVRCRAHQRKQLERLCRYITRPAIANERPKRNRAGQVVLQLKSPYRDGTTHVVISPLEFLQRLAALVPLSQAASDSLPWRARRARQTKGADRSKRARQRPGGLRSPRPGRLSPSPHELACLLKRVFDIDIEQCPRCGARLKIIATIVDPRVIITILTHLGLPARAPARPLPLFQAA